LFEGRRLGIISLDGFECPCCGKNEIIPELVMVVLSLETHLNDLKINSGYRCKKHNAAVGGSPTSSHLTGWAVDLAAPDSRTRFKIIYWLIEDGIGRIGIGRTYIHLDIDPKKPWDVLWLY
jgi:uncharacterized protein YcbK (DUF882 family)